jgi:hypothetical protein
MALEIVGRREADKPRSKSVMAGVGETALTMATGAIAEPLAGLYGLATTPFQGAESGAANVEAARRAMTYAPRTETGQRYMQNIGEFVQPVTSRIESANKYLGDKGFEYGGPVGGAIGASLLTGVSEMIPAGMAARQMRIKNAPLPTQAAPNIPAPINSPLPTQAAPPIVEAAPIVDTSAASVNKALQEVRAGRPEAMAAQVVPELQIMRDAEALGISLNPEHYSTSRAFIDMQEALKSRPGSKLSANEDKAISDLGKRADQLIADFGGYTDRDLLQQEVSSTFNSTITDLKAKSGLLYDSVDSVIPADVRVVPDITKEFMDEQVRKMGGIEGLSAQERELYDLISDPELPPTYARFDRERKLVGMALNGKASVYNSIPLGDLKRIYGAMGEEQLKFADAFGVGDDLRDANKLVTQRKAIEDASIYVLGRELKGSIIPKLSSAASGLSRGDTMKLKKLMDALPEDLRGQAAATMLGDLFGGGARKSGEMGQGFMGTFSALNRNPSAKAVIFSYLPIDALQRFDMIGRVSTGIYRAKSLENKSRTARDVIAALESGGLISNMYGGAMDIAKAEGVGSMVGAPGVGTAAVVANKITSKVTPAVEAADELLISPKFRQAVQEHMAGATDQADALLRSTPEYKKWLAAQDATIRAEVTAIGIIPWLTTDRQEQK